MSMVVHGIYLMLAKHSIIIEWGLLSWWSRQSTGPISCSCYLLKIFLSTFALWQVSGGPTQEVRPRRWNTKRRFFHDTHRKLISFQWGLPGNSIRLSSRARNSSVQEGSLSLMSHWPCNHSCVCAMCGDGGQWEGSNSLCSSEVAVAQLVGTYFVWEFTRSKVIQCIAFLMHLRVHLMYMRKPSRQYKGLLDEPWEESLLRGIRGSLTLRWRLTTQIWMKHAPALYFASYGSPWNKPNVSCWDEAPSSFCFYPMH